MSGRTLENDRFTPADSTMGRPEGRPIVDRCYCLNSEIIRRISRYSQTMVSTSPKTARHA